MDWRAYGEGKLGFLRNFEWIAAAVRGYVHIPGADFHVAPQGGLLFDGLWTFFCVLAFLRRRVVIGPFLSAA